MRSTWSARAVPLLVGVLVLGLVVLGSLSLRDAPHEAAVDTGSASVRWLVVAAPMLMLPVVVGAIAQRSVRSARGRAGGRHEARLKTLQSGVFALWGLLALALLVLAIAGVEALLEPWPPGVAAVLAYAALGLATADGLAIVVAASGLERNLMREDLAERERMQKELERSNRELAQFAYVASHDLKEPLRMVAGYTSLLEARYGDRLDDRGREFLGFATDGAQRMQKMIDDLLAYSRVRPSATQPADVALDDVVEVVRGQLRSLIEERGARVEAEGLPTLEGDRGQLVQLFQNLIHNGIKFNQADTPVVRVSAAREEKGWRIAVQDNGIGISESHEERIFQIFQRLHGRDEYPGNGIGLALCRKIVEQAGGRIWVESSLGDGATFLFTWADVQESHDGVAHPSEKKDPHHRGQRRGRATGAPRPG